MTTYVKATGEDIDSFLLIGFDSFADRPFRDWQVHMADSTQDPPALDLVAQPFTLLLSQPIADRHGWQVGDRITLAHDRTNTVFRVLGLLKQKGLGLAEGGQIALTDMATFQEFTGLQGVVDRVDVILTQDASAMGLEDLRDRWAGLLPPGVQVTSSSAARNSGRTMIRAYQLNLSAAREIARQLRLRDLGGVIVNDFIDMRREKHRRGVERALRDAMKRDRARTKILRTSPFGLIEMTRQRVRPGLKRGAYSDCPCCQSSEPAIST